MATIPVLLLSISSAVALAILLQGFSVEAVLQALVSGVELDGARSANVPDLVAALVERGGIYSMKEAIFVAALLVFLFVGAIDLLDTMPRLVDALFEFARGQKMTVLSALFASATTNALTSNQSATAFITGDAFAKRFDNLRIPPRSI